MYVPYTYDEENSADSGSGIKLTASEPLSPNAFVQIPMDSPGAVETKVHTPVSRQKKMRIPHGGSVERPAQRPQRAQRKAAPSVDLLQPESNIPSPSLHIVLETDEDDSRGSSEQQPESLAQFVASFPKIPDGLIYDDVSEPVEDEEDVADEVNEDHSTMDFDEDDRLSDDADIALDVSAFPRPQRQRSAAARSSVRASERVMPVNPRFEKMIRDATATATQPSWDTQPSADLPFRRMRTPSARPHGAARTSAVSGPLPRASAAPRSGVPGAPLPGSSAARARNSQPLPQRTGAQPGYPSSAMPKGVARPTRAGGAVAGPVSGGSPSPLGRAAVSRGNAASSFPSSGGMAAAGATRPLKSSLPSPLTAQPVPETPASVLGKPLLDASAIEESTIFDEPPIPIAEGMKDADKSHSKGRRFALIGAALVIVAAIGAFVVFGDQGGVPIPEFTITTTDAGGSGGSSGSGSSGAGANAGGDIAGVPSSSEDFSGGSAAGDTGAGSVTYKYTARTPSGIEYTVEESTTFDESGNCTFTTMRMQFPSDAAAKDFTDSLARDLGSKYTLDSLNGANATVTVDNSALGLNREDYENALRYSVDDLVILKK